MFRESFVNERLLQKLTDLSVLFLFRCNFKLFGSDVICLHKKLARFSVTMLMSAVRLLKENPATLHYRH